MLFLNKKAIQCFPLACAVFCFSINCTTKSKILELVKKVVQRKPTPDVKCGMSGCCVNSDALTQNMLKYKELEELNLDKRKLQEAFCRVQEFVMDNLKQQGSDCEKHVAFLLEMGKKLKKTKNSKDERSACINELLEYYKNVGIDADIIEEVREKFIIS